MKTSQKITEEIRTAIRDWYKKSGLTQPEMANLLGIKDPSVNSWLNGKSHSIRYSNWEKLYPYIEPYLPEGYMIHIGKVSARDQGIAIGNNLGSIQASNDNRSEIIEQIESILESPDFTPEEMVKFIKHVIRQQKNIQGRLKTE